MTDTFPEAFRRFERSTDISGITSFEQLRVMFGEWAKNKWKGTKKQTRSLAIEGAERGISPVVEKSEKHGGFVDKKGRYVKPHIQKKYRNLITGRYEKRPKGESD